ncbi:MAG: LysE family translocator [Gaiella sp.]|nr:LysE family translocator [Gaiella sp.]
MIPDPATLAVFCAAVLALLVVPGPAVLYVVASSIDGGRRAGFASVLGLQTGALVHVAAAAAGLSGLIAASALAFDTVKYLGAAYLVGIGLLTLFRGGSPVDAEQPREPTRYRYRRRFAQGVVVQILNPKTALFVLAFLPQFVDRSAGHIGLQMLFLGLLLVALAVVSDGTWALVAGTASDRLRGHVGFARAQRYVSGTVFVGLGMLTALTGSHRTTA